MLKAIRDVEERERRRREQLGNVRPVIHTDFQDRKVVAVGNTIHWSKDWKTFPDFLFDDIKKTLGADWGTAELDKPVDERHPILQWYGSLCKLQQRTKEQDSPDSRGVYESTLNGPSRAYLLLAYDLYVLKDHLALQEQVVQRLRHPDQFQGARYELFVAATMIRAGFRLDYEDETDSTVRHPEFQATDRDLDQIVSVEAKSRHRPGVLGFAPEIPQTESEFRLGIGRLFRDALGKPSEHPFVIFIDANMPPELARQATLEDWRRQVGKAIAEHDLGSVNEEEADLRSRFNLLLVTNTPDHYGEDDQPSPGDHYYSVIPQTPKRQIDQPQALRRIERALQQYGNVPQQFPDH